MLDKPNLHKLLSLLPEGVRVLFAGDQGQLPPVCIGKFLHNLVAEGSRLATLTKVLRQASDSDIPRVAALVRNGVAPTLAAWNGEHKGVYHIPPADVLSTLSISSATLASFRSSRPRRLRCRRSMTRRPASGERPQLRCGDWARWPLSPLATPWS